MLSWWIFTNSLSIDWQATCYGKYYDAIIRNIAHKKTNSIQSSIKWLKMKSSLQHIKKNILWHSGKWFSKADLFWIIVMNMRRTFLSRTTESDYPPAYAGITFWSHGLCTIKRTNKTFHSGLGSLEATTISFPLKSNVRWCRHVTHSAADGNFSVTNLNRILWL